MRRLLILLPLAASLAACNGGYPAYPDGERVARAEPEPYYRVQRMGRETDYIMTGRLLFPTDSARISDNAYEMVADIAADARMHPEVKVVVDGYTDTTGTPAHNQELSEARADAVADVLKRHGIESARISARGFGESKLAVPTGDQVKEAENRRVVIRLVDEG
ncbi:MAG: OmpA family protein [Alphaproteobacteria bacterium]|nr:OmpA family protein [Alphaproteobacteria bacterium]